MTPDGVPFTPGGPSPSAGQREYQRRVQEHAEAFQQRVTELEQEHRERVLHWAPVLCTCRRAYDRTDPGPPAASCIVHGVIIVSPDGKTVL